MRETKDCIILDNGAYSIKVGTVNENEFRIVPNSIIKAKHERKRVYIGEELNECLDRSSLFFVLPFEKGYLVNWDVEQQVWEKTLAPYLKDASNFRLLMSDPNYVIPAIKDLSDEIIFEVFGFSSVLKSSAPGFIANSSDNMEKRCVLVVDSGFSFTTIVPFVDGFPCQEGIIRIDIGGKALTNQLKEWISYRELNVLDETYVINECKEDSCFVSQNFEHDMVIAKYKDNRNNIKKEYVLPDFVTHQRGFLRNPNCEKDNLQTLTMNHERFCLPEALFRPSDLGLNQMGIAEATAESLKRCPANLRATLVSNISLIGGSTKFPGFKERFVSELSAMVDNTWTVKLRECRDPIVEPWKCAQEAISKGLLADRFVDRAIWEEYGESLYKRFLQFN